jgi:hypothetical protein
MMRSLLMLSTAVFAAAAGIYPEGHFDTAAKLTVSNFEDVMKETVCRPSSGVLFMLLFKLFLL